MKMLQAFRADSFQAAKSRSSENATRAGISNRGHRIFGLRQRTGTPSCGRELDVANFHRHISFARRTVDRIDGVGRPMPNMRHAKRRTVENRHRRTAGRSIGFHRKSFLGRTDATEDSHQDRQPRPVLPPGRLRKEWQSEKTVETFSLCSPF